MRAVALFSALASPAAAGGSQWSFDREFYLPGDLVAAAAPVAWVHNAQLGTPRDGPYGAWIARNDDMSPFDASVKDARYVGDLRVEEGCGDISGARFCPNIARVEFVLPGVEPGLYALFHCDAGCATTLGDIASGVFWVGPPDAVSPIRTRTSQFSPGYDPSVATTSISTPPPAPSPATPTASLFGAARLRRRRG